MIKSQIEFMCAGSEVTRYHTVHTLQRETVGHHSHGVAMLCHIIDPTLTGQQILLAALMHDLSEHQTGDIPSPAKREYGIGKQVEELEERLMTAAGFVFPSLTPKEQRVLKLADLAQGAMFSAREVQLGNSSMRVVFDRYLSYAESMILLGREREVFNVIKGLVK